MRLEDLVVTKFDVDSDELVPNLPYVLEKADTGQRQIAVLRSCEPDALSFGTWTRGITITPANAKLYKIYKADLSGDGMTLMFKDESFNLSASREISEEKLNEIKDAVNNPPSDALDLSQSYGGYSQAQANILCRRMLDYRTGKTEGAALGIENFYEVKSDVTIIRQFLYKVTRVIDNFRDQIEYEVCLPTSEKDKMYYMDRGWRIHPMFYNKENGCYMPSVIIHRPVQIMDSPEYENIVNKMTDFFTMITEKLDGNEIADEKLQYKLLLVVSFMRTHYVVNELIIYSELIEAATLMRKQLELIARMEEIDVSELEKLDKKVPQIKYVPLMTGVQPAVKCARSRILSGKLK